MAKRVGVVFLIVGLFCAAKFIQNHYLGMLALSQHSSLFYLPAAVIVLGSLITPLMAMVGIFLGSFLFQYIAAPSSDPASNFVTSLVPVIASGIAVLITLRINPRFREFHSPQERFSQIDAIDIFYFCVLYASFNVSLSEALFYIQHVDPLHIVATQIFAMAFGDLTGSFLVFVCLNFAFSAFLRLR